MTMKLDQNGKFYRLYFLCGSGASSFMLVIYDLYCQWKLLIKIQLYVIQLGIEFFSFLCRVLHTYWIYSSSNYEIWNYRAIIDCHQMPLKLLSDGTLSCLEIAFCWCCHIPECAGLYEYRRLILPDFQTFSQYNHIRLFGLGKPRLPVRVGSHTLISTV